MWQQGKATESSSGNGWNALKAEKAVSQKGAVGAAAPDGRKTPSGLASGRDLFDDPALRHAYRPIAHVIDNVGIVADQHHGQAILLFQIVEQI